MLMRRVGKALTIFRFGTSIGRFSSDDAASAAVKGLNLEDDRDRPRRVHNAD